MKGFPARPVPGESVSQAAKAVARRQAEQLTLVRHRAQPTAVYIARLALTAVFAYLLALQLPAASPRSMVAPLTALLVVQATLYHTIRSAIQRVVGVTAGVLAAVAVAAYVPFSWWVLGLLIAGTLALGLVLRLGADTLEVPISAMLIFSVDSHAAATSRIIETLIGAAAGLAAGLVFAPLRVQSAKDAIGDLSRQISDLLGQMADGLAAEPDPRRAAEWLDRSRALRGETERLDDALEQAEESIRLNPRRLRFPDPAAGLRDGVNTLERVATDLRVLARSIADSTRLEDSPIRDPDTRARLAAVIAELAAGVRAYGQLIEADPEPVAPAGPEPLATTLENHLEEAQRQQDQLAGLLATDPAERPDGWPLRGEILAHLDRLRNEMEPAYPLPRERRRPLRPHSRNGEAGVAQRGKPGAARRAAALRARARRTAARVRVQRQRSRNGLGVPLRAVGTSRPARARLRPALPVLAAALALLAMLLAAALMPLSVLARQNVVSNAGQAVTYLAISATGLVVARRQPRNPIGWLLLAIPVGTLLNEDSQAYAWLVYRSGDRLPFGSAALLLNLAWFVLFVAFPLVVLLFPDGRLPSPGWRWAMWAYLAAVASLLASGWAATVSVMAAHQVRVDSGGGLTAVDYPSGRTAWLSTVLFLVLPVLVAFWLVFAGRLVLSWRRAARGAERRQQLKWIVTGSLGVLGAGAVNSIISALDPHAPAAVQALSSLLNDAGLAVFAVCVGVAILRYRLYEIDRIISRTLAYAIVTGLLVGVYAALVLLATQVLSVNSPVAVAASTLAAAALFTPLRRRVQKGVDRRFNRARYDAEAIVAAFAARLKDEVDLGCIRDDLAGVVQAALEPAYLSVWLSDRDPY